MKGCLLLDHVINTDITTSDDAMQTICIKYQTSCLGKIKYMISPAAVV